MLRIHILAEFQHIQHNERSPVPPSSSFNNSANSMHMYPLSGTNMSLQNEYCLYLVYSYEDLIIGNEPTGKDIL